MHKFYFEHEVEVFCDGSGTTFGRPAGIGVAFRFNGGWFCINEHLGCGGTNNVAELKAVQKAISLFKTNQKILVRSDSQYAIGSLTLDWICNKNQELIKEIRVQLEIRKGFVRFEHIQGHAGLIGNEMADSMAKVGRKYGKMEVK